MIPSKTAVLKIQNTGMNKTEKTKQTQIRLLLKRQYDQSLHCLPFHQHLLNVLLQCKTKSSIFGAFRVTVLYVPFFFTINLIYIYMILSCIVLHILMHL